MINNDRFYKSEMLILSQLKKQDATVDELCLTFQSSHLCHLNNGPLLTSLFFFLESHLISQYSHNNTIYYHSYPSWYFNSPDNTDRCRINRCSCRSWYAYQSII